MRILQQLGRRMLDSLRGNVRMFGVGDYLNQLEGSCSAIYFRHQPNRPLTSQNINTHFKACADLKKGFVESRLVQELDY